jgi:hypothetical protein
MAIITPNDFLLSPSFIGAEFNVACGTGLLFFCTFNGGSHLISPQGVDIFKKMFLPIYPHDCES